MELSAQRGFPASDGGGFNPQRLGGSGLSGLSSLGSGGGQDSLRRRDKFEDSITVYFKYLDSTSYGKLDSSIRDFRLRFPVPATNIFLGNVGNASRSLLFSPKLFAGWDAGFHSFDIYRWKKESTRFIELLHTQNIKPSWNFSFNYRMINSPGFFKNQKTNHNNYIVTSWYQSLNKRYNNYFLLVSNKLQSSESGGIKNDKNYLDDIVYKDRFNIPTNIGGDPQFGRDFFSTKIETGNAAAI
jgi:Putative porin